MNDKCCFKALDRSLRDIFNNKEETFGGIQSVHTQRKIAVAPTRSDNIYRGKNSEFSKWSLSVGNDEIGTPDTEDSLNIRLVQIPEAYCIPDDENGLQKAIVYPKNDVADTITSLIVDMVDGPVITYSNYNTATPHGYDGGESELLYPTEYLNTLNYHGLPPYMLHLKKGVPTILLRNINIAGGLCNGTRMIVTKMLSKSVEAEIITGTRVGERVLFPRMSLIHKEPTLPFILQMTTILIKNFVRNDYK